MNTVVIGSDHAGYRMKQHIIKTLSKKFTIVDVGDFSADGTDDYPTFAKLVCEEVLADKSKKTKGILICGSGTGMVIAANKHKGIRAAFAYDTYSAKMARHDNDANILTLRGRKFSPRKAATLARTFLTTEFSGLQRHKRRLQQVARLSK